ncbi:MAG: hypothetical protein FJW40_20920 [Acidobacteria bacterium]|nr:hypothetical protein [Acidobacteriota bacterium]
MPNNLTRRKLIAAAGGTLASSLVLPAQTLPRRAGEFVVNMNGAPGILISSFRGRKTVLLALLSST